MLYKQSWQNVFLKVIIESYLNSSIKQLLPQCSLGTVTLEVGRIKTGPFHSERRPSQSSQVGSSGITRVALSTPWGAHTQHPCGSMWGHGHRACSLAPWMAQCLELPNLRQAEQGMRKGKRQGSWVALHPSKELLFPQSQTVTFMYMKPVRKTHF